MSRFAFVFRPFRRGLRQVLGDLEAEVMDAVWAGGEVTVRDVQRRLTRRRPIAYTTVMTTLARLARKRILTRRKVDGAYVYAPAVTREQLAGAVTDTVVDGLLDGFGPATVSRLLDRLQREDPERLDELARLIEARRRQR
jgi:predicted transcriptional regulator